MSFSPHIIQEKEQTFELGTIENKMILYDFDKIITYSTMSTPYV